MSKSSCPSLGPEMLTLVIGYSRLGGAGQEGGAQGFEDGQGAGWGPMGASTSAAPLVPGPGAVGGGTQVYGKQVSQRKARSRAREGGVLLPGGESLESPVRSQWVQAKKPPRPHPEVSCAIISLSHPPASAGLCLGCGLPTSEQAVQGQANSYTSVLGKG